LKVRRWLVLKLWGNSQVLLSSPAVYDEHKIPVAKACGWTTSPSLASRLGMFLLQRCLDSLDLILVLVFSQVSRQFTGKRTCHVHGLLLLITTKLQKGRLKIARGGHACLYSFAQTSLWTVNMTKGTWTMCKDVGAMRLRTCYKFAWGWLQLDCSADRP
jgi:hypothetical protein